MRLVHLPAMRHRAFETLITHRVVRRPSRPAPGRRRRSCSTRPTRRCSRVLRAARIPVADHVDGLEWQRAKWGRPDGATTGSPSPCRCAGRTRSSPMRRASPTTTATEFGAPTRLIAYGAPVVAPGVGPAGRAGSRARGVPPRRRALRAGEPRRDRSSPGTSRSAARLLGGRRLRALLGRRTRARCVTLRTSASGFSAGSGTTSCSTSCSPMRATYVHGHSVGGTNPALLRAIGAGRADARLRRGVQPRGPRRERRYFRTPTDVGRAVEAAEADPDGVRARGAALRERAARLRLGRRGRGVRDLLDDLRGRRRLAAARAQRPAARAAEGAQ